jgi:hypothetical protein
MSDELPKYELRILDMEHNGLTEDTITSAAPIPVPAVGDYVRTNKGFVKVVDRLVEYHGLRDPRVSYYVFCQPPSVGRPWM